MLTPSIPIGASILAGDFGHLAAEAQRIQKSGADSIHIDVMDGHFVPNLAFGPQAVAAINRSTDLEIAVHLMMYNPFDYIERFIAAGADMITFHFEATEDVEETLNYIRKAKVKAGLAFNPDTSFEMIPKYMERCDLILLMTVHPGFEGQAFIPSVLDKIRLTREISEKVGIGKGGVRYKSGTKYLPLDIAVDGGINPQTAKLCVEAGANYLISGSYLFQEKDMKKAVANLRSL